MILCFLKQSFISINIFQYWYWYLTYFYCFEFNVMMVSPNVNLDFICIATYAVAETKLQMISFFKCKIVTWILSNIELRQRKTWKYQNQSNKWKTHRWTGPVSISSWNSIIILTLWHLKPLSPLGYFKHFTNPHIFKCLS